MMTGAVLSICFAALLAMPLVARAAGDNGWQIVSGRYDSSHQTSEGIAAGQLANYGWVESPDGGVRLTKTVEPTGVEDAPPPHSRRTIIRFSRLLHTKA